MNRVEVNVEAAIARRKAELGRYPDEKLAAVVAGYRIPVSELAGGPRYSMIAAICEWEAAGGPIVLELTKRVDDLSERREIIALRNLSLLMMETKQLSERHRRLLRETFPVATQALRKVLLEEGFGEQEINAAELKRALTWE